MILIYVVHHNKENSIVKNLKELFKYTAINQLTFFFKIIDEMHF